MSVRQRARQHRRGDKAGEVRHVHHEQGADPVGDGAEAGEVDLARIGAAAGDDQLRPVLFGEAFDLVIIDAAVVFAHAILYGIEPFAGEIRLGAVGQMPTRRQ